MGIQNAGMREVLKIAQSWQHYISYVKKGGSEKMGNPLNLFSKKQTSHDKALITVVYCKVLIYNKLFQSSPENFIYH